MTTAGLDRGFWRGKRVFLTGHTGFKGSWLSLWLDDDWAPRSPATRSTPRPTPNLYELARVNSLVEIDHRRRSGRGDAGPGARGRTTRCGLPPGGPAARAGVVPRSRRHLRGQRDGHGEPPRGDPLVRDGAGGGQRDDRQVLREPRVALGLPRERGAGGARPVRQQQGVFGTGDLRLPQIVLHRRRRDPPGDGLHRLGPGGERHRRRRLRRRSPSPRLRPGGPCA